MYMYCYGPAIQQNVLDVIDHVSCMLRSLCGSWLYLFRQEEVPVPLVFCSCLVTVLHGWDWLCPSDTSFKCFIVPVYRSRTIFQNIHSIKTNCDDPLSKTFSSKDILNNQVQGETFIMRTEFIILRWVCRSGGTMNVRWTKRPALISFHNLLSSTSTTCPHPLEPALMHL